MKKIYQKYILPATITGSCIIVAAVIPIYFRSSSRNKGNLFSDESLQKVDIQSPTMKSPISIGKFFDLIKNKSLTDIQRNNLINQHIGRRVEWEGFVRDVSEGTAIEKNEYLLTIIPSLEKDLDSVHCWFGISQKSDLLSLKSSQKVVVSGLLEYDEYSPRLKDCSLIKIIDGDN